jgi:ABC-type branched-subunit amino acid transport system substrate-binding protein
LTGRPPFERANDLAVIYAHLQEPAPSVSATRPDLPKTVDAVLARGLAKESADRYASCRDLVEAFGDATATSSETTTTMARQRRRWLTAAAVVGVAALVAGVLLVERHRAGATESSALATGDGIAVVDAATNRLSRISLGGGPAAIAVGGGSVWVVGADSHTISRFDARTHAAIGAPFGLPAGSPTGLAYGEGALWVAAGSHSNKLDLATVTDSVVPFDASTGVQAGEPIPLKGHSTGFHHSLSQIAAGGGYVWVIDSDGAIERIDPKSRVPRQVPTDGQVSAVTFGDDAVWVLAQITSSDQEPPGTYVWSIDPQSLEQSQPISVTTTGVTDIAAGGGAVWLASPWDGQVLRIPDGQHTLSTIPVPGATGVFFDEGSDKLWIASPVEGTVQSLDPHSAVAGRAVPVSGSPQALAVADGTVFASVLQGEPAGVIRPAGSADVQVNRCTGVLGDPARPPDVVIVGDFPLDPLEQPYSPFSRPDSEAVAEVLREHHFRAGNHSVGFQLCDDRSLYGGPSCEDRALAYALASRVVAVVTGYLSTCAAVQIPIMRNAPGGPLAAIGPVNTEDELTMGRYSNYARLTPTEADQISVDIQLFASRGIDKVYVLHDSCGVQGCYFDRMSDLFQKSATSKLTIVGSAEYGSHDDPLPRTLPQKVRSSGATGVYIVGIPFNSGKLLKALQALGPARPRLIVSPESMAPLSALIDGAGTAATGMLVSSPNPPNGSLPPVGQQWLRRFAATQLGDQVPTSSSLAAASAETLLDAIARSDGTRRSITSKLGTTDLASSVIGPVRFTANGDITTCAITVYRVVGGAQFMPDVEADFQGAEYLARPPCRGGG